MIYLKVECDLNEKRSSAGKSTKQMKDSDAFLDLMLSYVQPKEAGAGHEALPSAPDTSPQKLQQGGESSLTQRAATASFQPPPFITAAF